MKGDSLGDRMKERYENRTRTFLPRRTYSIIRVDGKAFHTWAKGMDKPFDKDLMGLMDAVAVAMCEEIQGAKLAYVQSDEISILMTDFESINTEAWFNGNIQKIVSISAAIATAKFNDSALDAFLNGGIKKFFKMDLALFDSRVFTIPDAIEVENYFIWRQQDATRNSIQMAARALYSHKECENKNTSELQEMCFQKGVNWNDYSAREKRGGLVYKKPTGEVIDTHPEIIKTAWMADGAPIFTQERQVLRGLIPRITEETPHEEETP
jgi:tRNA(His) 5'-end guanylyltransferase